MSRILRQEETEVISLVEFKFGDLLSPWYRRYHIGQSNYEYEGNTFEAFPAIELESSAHSGDLEEGNWTIEAELKYIDNPADREVDLDFFDRLTNGEPHSPVFVKVIQILKDPTGQEVDEVVVLLNGKVTKGTRNHGGRHGVVRLEAITWKQNTKLAMGIQCNSQCAWLFGDTNCKKTVTTETSTVESLGISSLKLGSNVTNASPAFTRGFIERNGLRIGIKAQVGLDTFRLNRNAPLEWVGKSVKLYTGCNRTLEDCQYWNNVSNFGGLGYAMLDRNPLYEKG